MKQRLVSALVAIALVLLTGCGGSFLSGDSGKATSQGVTFISKQAPFVVSFLTSWTQSQPQVEKALKVFLGKQNLDYRKDIQPWLGSEITLAVTDLDFDHEASNGAQPGYLLIATTKDEAKSRQFLQTWLAQKLITGTELTFSPYKGTQLIYPQVVNPENLVDAARSDVVGSNNEGESNPASSNLASTFASTVVSGRFVLIANHPQVLRQAINNAQAVDLSLVNSPSYQQTRGSLDQSELGWGFINLPALTAWLGKHGELTQEPPFASLAITLSPQNQGLVAKTALITGNPETSLDSNPDPQVQSPTLITTNPTTDYLPASSGLAISGTNLQSFLAKYITTTDESTESRESNLLATGLGSLLEKVDQELQIDFSQDILPWLTGDYALGWLPSKDAGENLGKWLFVTDRTSPQAQTAIAHLDQLALNQGFSITPLKLAEQPVTLWTQLKTKTNKQGLKDVDTLVRGVHAQVEDYEIFASDVGVMGAALGIGSQPLTKDKQFQEAIALALRSNIAPLAILNQGYIYLDWPTARPFLESQFPLLRFLEVPLEPFLTNLETLSFTSYGTKAGITSSELFFNFQKSE